MSIAQEHRIMIGRSRRKSSIISFGLVLSACTFAALGFTPPEIVSDVSPAKLLKVPFSPIDISEQIQKLEEQNNKYIHLETFEKGDSLSSLFTKLKIEDTTAEEFIKKNKAASKLLKVQSGTEIVAITNDDGQLLSLQVKADATSSNTLEITKTNEAFSVLDKDTKLERRVEMHLGHINSSFYAALDSANIPDAIASQLVDMFSTRIDFSRDLKIGDSFNIVYETFWQDGSPIKSGEILAAQFNTSKNTFDTVLFEGTAKQPTYFTLDGKSLKKSFLLSPIGVTRISSGFAMRNHPIFGDWRQHKGVDFAAPTGTTVISSGDGKIAFVGQMSGYGNVVIIEHPGNISTLYAHLSRFNAQSFVGKYVAQGEPIGYVGSTGWATGPHLHYEFRVNNIPKNPVSPENENIASLTGKELVEFKQTAAEMRHRFSVLDAPHVFSKVAMN